MTVYYLDADGPLRTMLAPPIGTEPDRARQLDVEALAMTDLVNSRSRDDHLISSQLLPLEIARVLRNERIPLETAADFLDNVQIAAIRPSDFDVAAEFPTHSLKALDALHLAVAARLQVDHVVTYDRQLSRACEGAGISALSPGRAE